MSQQHDFQKSKGSLKYLLLFAIIVFGVTVFLCTSLLRKKDKKMEHTKSFIPNPTIQGFEHETSNMERNSNLKMKHNHLKEQIHLSEQGRPLQRSTHLNNYSNKNRVLIQEGNELQETEEEDKEIKELLRKRIDERQHQEISLKNHQDEDTPLQKIDEKVPIKQEEEEEEDEDDDDLPIIDPSTLEPGYYGDKEHFDQAVFADTKVPTLKKPSVPSKVKKLSSLSSAALSFKQPIPTKKCKTTVHTRQFLTDSRGVQCSVFDIDPVTRCCLRGQQHTCAGVCSNGCCRSYPSCVSCCSSPSNREAISQSFMSIKQHAKPHIRVLYRDITVTTPIFDYCVTRCRTSSQSVVNENQYRNELNYCFV